MSQTHALYRLQTLDLDIEAQRARLHEIAAALADHKALHQAQAAVQTLRDALQSRRSRVTDLNLEIQAITEQTRQLTERLYGGKVQNPKELQDIEHKIAELKRRHGDLENELLEVMIEVEDLEASLETATAQLDQAEHDDVTRQETLTAEQRQVKLALKKSKADREGVVATLTEESLALYESLRPRRQGYAVAVLKGERCSSCGVDQTSIVVQQVRRGQELVLCANCGRILIAL